MSCLTPPSPAAAGEDWGLCHAQYGPPLPPGPAAAAAGSTVFTADKGQVVDRNILKLQGNVLATRGEQRLRADTALYDKTSGRIVAEGGIVYASPDLSLTGEHAEMRLDIHSGWLTQADYFIRGRHARGEAQEAEIKNEDLTVLQRVTYTTCDPGNSDWLLRSRAVRLDQGRGVGSARHVVLSFKHLPFFYLPYMTFPIDDRRKSGFLAPSLRNSTENGSEFTLPYYLNIAPRFDATVAPRRIARRGGMLTGEFRYLNPASHGQIDAEYLPDDKLTGTDRSLLRYHHEGRPAPRLRLALDLARVSDGDYFRELGNSLSTASITHLEQRADLSYQGSGWTATARLQGYQTVDETIPDSARPYQRLPQILFSTQRPERNARLNYLWTGEFVNYQRDGRVSGTRLDLSPGISLPLRATAGYLEPTLLLRHTAYNLQDPPAGTTTRPRRTLPVFTLDGGVFLERDSHWGRQPMRQTLEPRLYYLYAPFRDQSALPLFDTGLPDFNYSRLFTDNRFSGADRVGDANQLSLAVTTRFLEPGTGRERLRAAIGRIYYFRDRRVTLSGTPETTAGSDIVAEAGATLLPGLSAKADIRWNAAGREVDKGGLQLQYKPAARRIFNLAYRFREASLEQTDVSVLWPLGRHWHLIGRHNYSILDGRALETLAGLEYQSCCWRLQIVNRRYINDAAGDTNATLYLQLVLKGLTSIGDRLENVLERGILGYEE